MVDRPLTALLTYHCLTGIYMPDLLCRVNRPINLPTFVPLIRFNIDRTAVPTPVHGVFPASVYDS